MLQLFLLRLGGNVVLLCLFQKCRLDTMEQRECGSTCVILTTSRLGASGVAVVTACLSSTCQHCPKEPRDQEGTQSLSFSPTVRLETLHQQEMSFFVFANSSRDHVLLPAAIFDCHVESLVFQHGQRQQRSSNLTDNKRNLHSEDPPL